MGRGAEILGDPHTGGGSLPLLVRTEGVCEILLPGTRAGPGHFCGLPEAPQAVGMGCLWEWGCPGEWGCPCGWGVHGNGGVCADGGVCGSPERKCHV